MQSTGGVVVTSAEKINEVPLKTKLFAELVGTFALTLVAAGSAVVPAASGATALPAAGAVAVGLVLMALVYSIGRLSGSYVNPAVTLGVALRGALEWKLVPLYWVAQIAGGLLAAAFLLVTFGNVAQLGSTLPSPSTSVWQAFAMEAVMTAVFVGVILAVIKEPRSQIGHNAGIAIGATLALCGLFGGAASGASLNPARSIGPALLSGATHDLWVYIAAPLAGALIAAAVDRLLHGEKLSR